jgi:hypothetical protein
MRRSLFNRARHLEEATVRSARNQKLSQRKRHGNEARRRTLRRMPLSS